MNWYFLRRGPSHQLNNFRRFSSIFPCLCIVGSALSHREDMCATSVSLWRARNIEYNMADIRDHLLEAAQGGLDLGPRRDIVFDLVDEGGEWNASGVRGRRILPTFRHHRYQQTVLLQS